MKVSLPLKKKKKIGVKSLQQLARINNECRILMNTKNHFNSKNGPINVSTNNQDQPMLQKPCKLEYSAWKNEKLIIKLNDSDNCFMVDNGDLILPENVATLIFYHSLVVIGR